MTVLGKIAKRVTIQIVFRYFEMQVRASGPPALSNLGQALALPHDLSFFDEIDPIMGVDSAVAVPVTDDHDITVAAQHIAEDDLSVRSGYDRGAAWGSNVDTIVETAVPWAKA